MSKFCIYLNLETYMHQWITHSLGNPVVFPDRSNENAIIRRFINRQPEGAEVETARPGLTAICIPDSKAKPVQYYNYAGKACKEAVKECIEDLFRRNLWEELSNLDYHPCGINKIIYAWCEMHGIDIDYAETIRQKYYRMRKKYAEKGIILKKKSGNRTDDEPDIEQLRTILQK